VNRCLGSLVIAILAFWQAGMGGAAQISVHAENLPALVFQYLDSADSEEADRLLEAILQHPDASIERVIRIVETERTYESRPIGTLPDEHIRVQGQTYAIALSVPLTYQPSKGYALIVCLHGAGFTGDAYLERWQARLGEDYILACPTYPAGAWFTRRAEELVLATVRHVRQRYHVDPDRIFLTGMSNGGIGAWLIGMHNAPLFAGVAPMAGGLDDVLMPFLANLRNTPVYIIHGAKDQVMPVTLSRAIARELTAMEYPHIYREHQGEHPMAGGHYFPREELPALVTWLNAQRRDPLPTKLTLVREASRFQPFGWVRLDSTDPIAAFSDDLVDKRDEHITQREYARLEATIVSTNRIEVHAERIQRYSVFLNDRLIDPAKPVTIVTNGRVSFEGLVTASLETLLRQARLRQDPRQLFPFHLVVAIPKAVP
jgi:pimeloyl-ACP methyl ester carboxylesterase